MSELKGQWAIILGASSGFGATCAIELARRGMNVCGVHLDRKATLPEAERIAGEIRNLGGEALFFNINASDEEKRTAALDALAGKLNGQPVRTFIHSLAFGTLRSFIGEKALTKAQLEMTLDVMANSLVWWVQDMHTRKMLARGSKIFAMTSAGSDRAWMSYGAVSAAKCTLESHIRQLTLELAPEGIACNALRAGVTETPALKKIPGNEEMLETARKRNPGGRITTPQDVAKTVAALSVDGIEWMTGNIINVDGGEMLV